MRIPRFQLPRVLSLSIVAAACGCAATTADSGPVREPVVSVQLFPNDHLDQDGDQPLPAVHPCDDERLEVALADGDDDRCAEEIVASAAVSYLFVRRADQGQMVGTYESDRAIEDALDEAEFRRIVRRADTSHDGFIDRGEAVELEREVAELVEG